MKSSWTKQKLCMTENIVITRATQAYVFSLEDLDCKRALNVPTDTRSEMVMNLIGQNFKETYLVF